MDNSVSVVTIVKNRIPQLKNLIKQLENSTLTPAELIIVWMTSPSEHSLLTSDKFKIVHKFAASEPLPIARARNRGIEAANSELVAYVAVDALFSQDALLQGVRAWKPGTIVTSQPRQVSEKEYRRGYANIASHLHLREVNVKETHNGMPSHDNGRATMFFIHKEDFERTGGFDQRYTGFGLNDEDFFSQCRELGIAFNRLPTEVFIRDTSRALCPIHHLLDFCCNAEQFRRKWGRYPRHQTLKEYADKGYVNADFRTRGLLVQHRPDQPAPLPEKPDQSHLTKKRITSAA